jgi:hypothetical protein
MKGSPVRFRASALRIRPLPSHTDNVPDNIGAGFRNMTDLRNAQAAKTKYAGVRQMLASERH